MAKKRVAPGATKPKGLTLAHVAHVTYAVGRTRRRLTGEQLAQLMDATRPLYGADAELDFLNHHAIAIELRDMAEVLTELRGDDGPSPLSYFVDQLRRLSQRVAALAPRSGNDAPSWYTVEVRR